MSDYAILRFKKLKSGAAGIEAHNERKKERYKSNPDIRTELSHRNYHLVKPDDTYSNIIKKRIKESACTVRKNSIKFVDTVLTASSVFFEYGSPELTHKFFKTAYEFIEGKVGKENIISAVVHMDEKTPHMHLVFVPLTKDNRLTAKEIIGDRAQLRKWQNEYYGAMSREFPILKRGKDARLTGRKHLETSEFKELANLDRADRELRMIQILKTQDRYIKSIPDHLKKEIDEYNRQARKKQKAR